MPSFCTLFYNALSFTLHSIDRPIILGYLIFVFKIFVRSCNNLSWIQSVMGGFNSCYRHRCHYADRGTFCYKNNCIFIVLVFVDAIVSFHLTLCTNYDDQLNDIVSTRILIFKRRILNKVFTLLSHLENDWDVSAGYRIRRPLPHM